MSTRPAGPVPQIPNQSCQANILNLRYTSANQAPAKSNKSHMPAKWGVPSPPARTAMVMRAPSLTRAYSLARARPWSRVHLHGYVHICTAMARKPTRRDQRPALTDQAPIQLTQMPCGCVTSPRIYAPNCYSKYLGGMGINGDCGVDDDDRCGAAACAIGPEGPIMVRPEGRTDGTPEGQPASSGLIVEPEGWPASSGPIVGSSRPDGSTACCCVCDYTLGPQTACQQAGMANCVSNMASA